MSDIAIQLEAVGKMYRLYSSSRLKLFDTLGLGRWLVRGRFQEFWAIKNIDLEVPRGQRLGIIGPNGAGKSTLLKLIAQVLPPTCGTVRVSGRIQSLMELGTGFHPELTGRQNIRASLAYQGLMTREIREKEEEIVDFAEIHEFIDQPIKTYSAGMYARLGFSAATCVFPDLLIVDEILSTGDAYFTGKCLRRMKQQASENHLTLLYVSHDMPSVMGMCDRVIRLRNGRMVDDGEPFEVTRAYYLEVQEEEHRRRELEAEAARTGAPVRARIDSAKQPAAESKNGHGFAHRQRQPAGSIVTWKQPDPRIEDVKLLDGRGQRVDALVAGDSLTVQIDYVAEQPVNAPVFAMTIYTVSGENMLHANTVVDQAPIERIEGRGQVRFVFDPLLLGVGDYVVECSIFEYLDPMSNTMPPYYDQHYPCGRLRVLLRPGMATNLGRILNPRQIVHAATGSEK